MNAPIAKSPAGPSAIYNALRNRLGGRRGYIAAAAVLIAAGLYLGWGWLAAVGIAPVLLSLAPCAAMCALGLCMSRRGGKSCSSEPQPKGNSITQNHHGGSEKSRAQTMSARKS